VRNTCEERLGSLRGCDCVVTAYLQAALSLPYPLFAINKTGSLSYAQYKTRYTFFISFVLLCYRADYWTFRVEDTRNCRLPLGYDQADVVSCDMYFSLCKPLGAICEGYENSSTCQIVTTADSNVTVYDMGTYKNNEDIVPLSES